MDLYTVVPQVGVVEPINIEMFKKLFPGIKEPPLNGYIITNKPFSEKGKAALRKAKWVESNGYFIPPMQTSFSKKKGPKKKKDTPKKS